LARAPLLLFTDDDVRVDPHWVEAYRHLFARRRDALMLAGGPIVPIPHDLGPWPDWFPEAALADGGLLHHRDERILGQFEYVWGGNMAVPKGVFDRLGLWDETVGLQGDTRVTRQDSEFFEDTELQDRTRKGGGSVCFCPTAIVHHRVGRRNITPRRISSTAFTRGRNDLWIQELPIWHEARFVPRRNALGGLLALAANLFQWSVWVLMFRLRRGKTSFDRARRAAFASGRSLDSLRAGRKSIRLFRGAGHIAFAARALLLRLTPDVP
jgi:GT2 family glycosyltransferase